MPELKIRVNEQERNVTAAPDTPLLYVLMDELELKGPRFGCGLGQCGSCSVLVNGVETRSCMTKVADVTGKSVTTLEGLPAWYAAQKKLRRRPALHPVQQAMIDEQALQCGYCFNGMIIKASELLSKTPQPTDAQIRTAMNGHLCRCGTYPRILKAIPARFASDEGGAEMSTRREFLKTGGALVVGFSLGEGDGLGAQGRGARGAAPVPDLRQVDTWLAIHADNTATVYIGFAELGQGASTALLQIAAEELDLDMPQINTVQLDTRRHAQSGRHLFQRVDQPGDRRSAPPRPKPGSRFCKIASARLAAPLEAAGGFQGRGYRRGNPARSVTYGELIGDKPSTLPSRGRLR